MMNMLKLEMIVPVYDEKIIVNRDQLERTVMQDFIVEGTQVRGSVAVSADGTCVITTTKGLYFFTGRNLLDAVIVSENIQRPKKVCLCGSTRFENEYAQANAEWTQKGYIVLSVGVFAFRADISHEQKVELDRLHRFKIAESDEVLIINQNGYIGPSTYSEIQYALSLGKPVSYMFPGFGEPT